MTGATTEEEHRLVAAIAAMTGGTVTNLVRQPRWRPAWFADVERDGQVLKVHARGDRQSDMTPFPDLQREAHILEALAEVGVKVPHIYGYCADPKAIIMEAIAGTRDMAEAKDQAERQLIIRQYIAEVARMHAAPLEPFRRRGIAVPDGADGIALAGLGAYEPLYRRTKTSAEPLIEFAFSWIRRNVPHDRTRPAFVQYDSGQFLFAAGKLTGLYDFEFGMVSDPMVDLATMRMRDSVEPLGVGFPDLLDCYARETGMPVDEKALLYYNTVFSAVATSQFFGTLRNPKPGDPHDVYLEWDLALRRVLTLVLAEAMAVEIEAPDPSWIDGLVRVPRFSMLADAIAGIAPDGEMSVMKAESASRLAEFLGRDAQCRDAIEAARRHDASVLLSVSSRDNEDFDATLEALVLKAGPERDADLLRFFHRDVARAVQAVGDTRIGRAAAHVRLPPLQTHQSKGSNG